MKKKCNIENDTTKKNVNFEWLWILKRKKNRRGVICTESMPKI